MTWFAGFLAVFTAIACVFTAVADLRRDPRAIETTRRLGIPDEKLRVLAAVKIAAAVGLAVGLVADRLLVLVSACLVLYFAIAVTAHVRVRDGVRNTVPAFVMLAVSTTLALAALAA